MKKSRLDSAGALLCALCAIVSACEPSAGGAIVPAATSAAMTFADPFAYCAAVGTVDKPDARHIGAQVPDEIIEGFKKAAGLESSTEPMDMLRKTTVWRCMNGKVYACNFGANLPCDSKANTDRTPTQAMGDFCAANPNSDEIPMSMTGHDTIYNWHCVNDKAEVQAQIAKVDAAGYIQNIWYEVVR